MIKPSRQRIEQETTITFNAEEDCALVGTAWEPMKNRLSKRKAEIHRKDGDWITYRVPKSWIKVSPPKQVSEAQRKAMSERAKSRSFGRKSDTTSGKPGSNGLGGSQGLRAQERVF